MIRMIKNAEYDQIKQREKATKSNLPLVEKLPRLRTSGLEDVAYKGEYPGSFPTKGKYNFIQFHSAVNEVSYIRFGKSSWDGEIYNQFVLEYENFVGPVKDEKGRDLGKVDGKEFARHPIENDQFHIVSSGKCDVFLGKKVVNFYEPDQPSSRQYNLGINKGHLKRNLEDIKRAFPKWDLNIY